MTADRRFAHWEGEGVGAISREFRLFRRMLMAFTIHRFFAKRLTFELAPRFVGAIVGAILRFLTLKAKNS